MAVKIVDKNIRLWLIAILFILCCFQNLSLFTFLDVQFKLCHLYSILFVPLFFENKKIKIPNTVVLAFILYSIILSFVALFWSKISGVLFKYVFCLYLLFILYNFSDDFTVEDFLRIIRISACIIMPIVLFGIFRNFSQISSFLNQSYAAHPIIITIFGGGVNLEATWLGFMGFAFKRRAALIYNALALLVSALYGSRAGIVMNILCLFWLFLQSNVAGRKMVLFSAAAFVAISVFILVLYSYGILDNVILRFSQKNSSKILNGRAAMWNYFGKLFNAYPLGVGAGNAINALRHISGINFSESNLHNVYFQMFIDFGWLGGAYYLGLVGSFALKNIKRWSNPLVAMMFSYFILSLVQFTGPEIIGCFVLGAFLVTKRAQDIISL